MTNTFRIAFMLPDSDLRDKSPAWLAAEFMHRLLLKLAAASIKMQQRVHHFPLIPLATTTHIRSLKPRCTDTPEVYCAALPTSKQWHASPHILLRAGVSELPLYRTVRMEACTIMGIVAPQAGRGLVRALKVLLGPWCLAKADPHSDTAKNARVAFGETFPGAKAREAVTLFRNQVCILAHIGHGAMLDQLSRLGTVLSFEAIVALSMTVL